MTRKWAAIVFLGLVQLGFLKVTSKPPKNVFLIPTGISSNAARFEPKPSDTQNLAERKKILFLIEQVKASPFRFIRNGSEYSGEEAAAHLKMKYGQAYSQINSAKDFILHIASSSILTGAPYLVVTPSGERYLAQDLFFNELERLEQTAVR